jgi:hypothetical protein
MGVSTLEVGYTSATTGRGDHEVHNGHVVALGGKKKQISEYGHTHYPLQKIYTASYTLLRKSLCSHYVKVFKVTLSSSPYSSRNELKIQVALFINLTSHMILILSRTYSINHDGANFINMF